MIHKFSFDSIRQSRTARFILSGLIALAMILTVAMPTFAWADDVLMSSGYTDTYYYECTYTPTYEKKAEYHDGTYHSYYIDGYHVECTYIDIEPKPQPRAKPKHGHHGHGHHGHHGHGHHGHGHGHHNYHCTYTVQQGDNLSTIADYYGTTYQHLGHANHLPYPYYLNVGDVLYVPCHY